MSGPIVHVDMDAFFAAVEQRDNPAYRGQPVIVGGLGPRGVVSTCSYEARRFGVRSAMPMRQARRLCPQGIFLPGDFARYVAASRQLHAILRQASAVVEPLSIDEAFLDLTGQEAVPAARKLKADIREALGLTASIGVSYCKFLAKLASDMEKPDGFTVIDRARAEQLLPALPVRALWGIGEKTEGHLARLGIHTVADLRRADRLLLRQVFGKRAGELIDLAYGIDPRPVSPPAPAKSISEETTFPQDVTDWAVLEARLREFAAGLSAQLERTGMRARTVTLKLRYADFSDVTRSLTLAAPAAEVGPIGDAGMLLLARLPLTGRKVRLIGLGVSKLTDRNEPAQLLLPFD